MNKIALLLSGGVDSSVALHLLCQADEKPDCYYIHIGPDEDDSYSCTSDEDIEMCQAVTTRYGVKFEVIDLHKEYWTDVVNYTMDTLKKGYTPNPDIMCNTLIKFGAFYKKIGYKYDFIATGHYAVIKVFNNAEDLDIPFISSTYWNNKNIKYWICPAKDPVKDQVDFIANINTSIVPVSKMIFPVGHLMKEEVRKIAEENHLINAKRKDSQGICFIGKINYNQYIDKYLGNNSGPIIDADSGKHLGRHYGYWHYTIGQRKGLGLAGGPWFVIGKDVEKNYIYVSKNLNESNVTKFYIQNINWLTEDLFDIYKHIKDLNDGTCRIWVTFKIRHSPEVYNGELVYNYHTNEAYIESEIPVSAASGQWCILYDENYVKCYGCGEILNKEVTM